MVDGPNAKLPPMRTSGNVGIQKLLATTRIQQEIEQQTQRELALKAIGSIRTTSQERTDTKVAKLGVLDSTAACNKYASDVHANSIIISSSFPSFSEVVPENNKNEQAKYAFTKNASKPIKSSLSSSSSVLNTIARKPCISPLFGTGSTKSVSMHKFISSKGKVVTTPAYNHFSSHQNLSTTATDYHETKPPQFARNEYKGQLRRNSLSAENKILEELKEMKAREEELR